MTEEGYFATIKQFKNINWNKYLFKCLLSFFILFERFMDLFYL